MGVHAGHRLRALLVAPRLPTGGRSGSTRRASVPGAPWWLKSLAATTLAQGGDRRSSRHDVGGHSRIGRDRLAAAATPNGDCSSCDALDELDQLSARGGSLIPAGQGSRPSSWQALASAESCLERSGRSHRYAVRADVEGRVQLSSTSPLWPLPEEPQALRRGRPHERPSARVGLVAVFGAIIGSFLNVCIYRLPLAAVDRLACVGLSALRTRSSPGSRTSRS